MYGRELGELLGGFVERLGLAEDGVVSTSQRQRVGQGVRIGKFPRGTKRGADP